MEEKDWWVPPKEFLVFVHSVGDVGSVGEDWWRGQLWWWTKGGPLSKARSPLKGERKGPTKTSGVEEIYKP